MTAQQIDAITDPQSIIAALRTERDAARSEKAALAEELAARDAALAQRNSEHGERIEHQVATLDVLKAMSASPGDPQPVFDLIVEHASKLCNVPTATLFEYDGALVHIRSAYRVETVVAVSPWAVANEHFPMRPTRGSITCRAILDRQIIHVRDLNADRELAGFVRALGHRSQVSVPLMRDGTAIGVISIAAQEPGGFSDSQVALLQTFAEQAVIAITSAETYRGLHEALEQQTATAEVLRVINTSPGNLRPVFDAMLERALRLCGAAFGGLSTFDGDRRTIMASTPAYEAYVTAEGATSVIPPLMLRVIETKCPVQIADRRDREGFRAGSSVRTLLHVPLLKDETVLGCNSRAFSIAITAWAAKFCNKAISLSE